MPPAAPVPAPTAPAAPLPQQSVPQPLQQTARPAAPVQPAVPEPVQQTAQQSVPDPLQQIASVGPVLPAPTAPAVFVPPAAPVVPAPTAPVPAPTAPAVPVLPQSVPERLQQTAPPATAVQPALPGCAQQSVPFPVQQTAPAAPVVSTPLPEPSVHRCDTLRRLSGTSGKDTPPPKKIKIVRFSVWFRCFSSSLLKHDR